MSRVCSPLLLLFLLLCVDVVVVMVVMCLCCRQYRCLFICYLYYGCPWCRCSCSCCCPCVVAIDSCLLLRYPRTCFGIRGLGDLFVYWCFWCCVCIVLLLLVCVCLFDDVFARRGYCCYCCFC